MSLFFFISILQVNNCLWKWAQQANGFIRRSIWQIVEHSLCPLTVTCSVKNNIYLLSVLGSYSFRFLWCLYKSVTHKWIISVSSWKTTAYKPSAWQDGEFMASGQEGIWQIRVQLISQQTQQNTRYILLAETIISHLHTNIQTDI